MSKKEWCVIASIVFAVFSACNLLWAAVKSSLEFGIPSPSTLNLLGLGVVSLPIVIAVVVLVAHFRTVVRQ